MNDTEFRDACAIAAMQALVGAHPTAGTVGAVPNERKGLAENAFRIADAMVTERKARNTHGGAAQVPITGA